MTQENVQASPRPLSPHLQIYKWHLTMMVSILHRATGIALAAGTILLIAWLWSAAYNAAWFDTLHRFFGTLIGRLMLFGWSLSFWFHFCNGIRHLFWDTGRGFEVHTAERTGWAVVLFSSVLTLLTWTLVLAMGGR